ncbi:uncharacterized protein PV07_12724 [Cladophialophora immunda]|uniref:Uncharacterized protein n=1 Tax=Cladophialophora immunda TaxID=569365 RepID=A0A0D2CE69_9EURO|nr:uncharacterized protein PV07_12724 [Cladophialophora immunda]KIW21854.1 hypothetical protein PV07_12724 [Cladophialophora immunda]
MQHQRCVSCHEKNLECVPLPEMRPQRRRRRLRSPIGPSLVPISTIDSEDQSPYTEDHSPHTEDHSPHTEDNIKQSIVVVTDALRRFQQSYLDLQQTANQYLQTIHSQEQQLHTLNQTKNQQDEEILVLGQESSQREEKIRVLEQESSQREEKIRVLEQEKEEQSRQLRSVLQQNREMMSQLRREADLSLQNSFRFSLRIGAYDAKTARDQFLSFVDSYEGQNHGSPAAYATIAV